MNKEVKLTKLHGRLSDREPFIMAENETLTLEFKSDYILSDLLISIKNGDTVKQYKSSGVLFAVPKEVCFAGALEISISLLKSAEVVKTWNVAPILIKEINAGFEAFDAFRSLEQRVSALEDKHKIIL